MYLGNNYFSDGLCLLTNRLNVFFKIPKEQKLVEGLNKLIEDIEAHQIEPTLVED